MSSQIASRVPDRVARLREPATQRQLRMLTIQLLGPLTMLGGLVWAIAQPYRLAFLYPDGKGIYDFLFQSPLLVILVGIVYAALIAPGLVKDLEDQELRAPGR